MRLGRKYSSEGNIIQTFDLVNRTKPPNSDIIVPVPGTLPTIEVNTVPLAFVLRAD
jgi:hypothetical protein